MEHDQDQLKARQKEPKSLYKPSFFYMVIFLPVTLTVLTGLTWAMAHRVVFQHEAMSLLTAYLQNPFRVFYVVLLWVEGLLAYLVSPIFSRPTDEMVGNWVHWQQHWWEIVLVISVFSDSSGLWLSVGDDGVRWAGGFLLLLALGLETASRATRRKLDQIDPDADYPRSGIFSLIRFPEITELILQSLGIALLFNSWVGLLLALFFIGVIIPRVLRQDRIMLRKYGQSWSDYQAHVSRLVPWVW